MIKQVSHVNVWVHDQDEALAWYTEKLGFELRDDITLPELDGFRWLTVGPVGQPDFALALMDVPGPPGFAHDTAQTSPTSSGLGRPGGRFFPTDDSWARARGSGTPVLGSWERPG